MIVLFFFFLLVNLMADDYQVVKAPNWEGVNKWGASAGLSFQSRIWDEEFYIKLRLTQKMPSKLHRPWLLENERFVVGKQREDFVSLTFDKGTLVKDLWYWGVNRNGWGYADDRNILQGIETADQGVGPWRLNLRPWQIRQNPSRYLQQTPEGSRADVRAHATYIDGVYTVVFSRKLDTGQADDLLFSGALKLVFLSKAGMTKMVTLRVSQP